MKTIREQETELFASMAKVEHQPLATDTPIDPNTLSEEEYQRWLNTAPFDEVLAHARTIDWYAADYEFAKRTWPGLSDEECHRYAMGCVP
jgi:hypothetical protein